MYALDNLGDCQARWNIHSRLALVLPTEVYHGDVVVSSYKMEIELGRLEQKNHTLTFITDGLCDNVFLY